MPLMLLIFLMVVLFSFQSLFTRLYVKQYQGPDAAMATPVFSVVYGVSIAAVSLITGGFSFSPSLMTWVLGLANAAVLMLYNISMIESGKRGSYSFLMIADMFGGIILPILVGSLFLHEQLTGLQLFAVALMLIALVVMNSKGLSLKGASKSYFFWCALLFLANGLYGSIMNLQATAMHGAEHAEMLVILFLFSAILAAGRECLSGRGKRLAAGFRMGRKACVLLLICCLSAAFAASLMLHLLTKMDSGVLYTIDNGGVLALSILYAIVLFRERPNAWQIIGMLMALVSIVLIG